jgi:hypothetical protein
MCCRAHRPPVLEDVNTEVKYYGQLLSVVRWNAPSIILSPTTVRGFSDLGVMAQPAKGFRARGDPPSWRRRNTGKTSRRTTALAGALRIAEHRNNETGQKIAYESWRASSSNHPQTRK